MNNKTNKKLPQFAVFDFDGTLTHHGKKDIPKEVIEGLRYLRSKKVITTICTGRPYVRIKQLLGDYFDEVIHEDALLAVEHGAKIVNKDGQVITESVFTEADIDKLIEFTGLNIDMVHFLAFNPADISNKTKIWCPEPADAIALQQERGWYADVLSPATLMDFKDELLKTPVSNVTLKLKDFIHVENLKLEFTGGSIKALFQDGSLEYMKVEVNKARSINFIAKHLGIYEHNILVAGNAINDVDMLNMEAQHRILVGPDGPERKMILGYIYGPELLEYVDTPEQLGAFLKELS